MSFLESWPTQIVWGLAALIFLCLLFKGIKLIIRLSLITILAILIAWMLASFF